MEALIVYGTRGGATKEIAQEMEKALAEKGFEVTVKCAKEASGIDVDAFDLIIIGSGVQMGKWEGKTTNFLKKNQQALASKRVALFSSGMMAGDPAMKEEAERSIAKVASAFPAIKPVALAYFGGYLDFNSGKLLVRLIRFTMKKHWEKMGIDTSKPYDTRDFEAIHKWAGDVAAKVRGDAI
ncbi:MAG TPA: flavodoxin domain-containing protein [Methanothrix sp.]|nr:flavodoxin domain-containing protein [Methanothrix sp.]